MEWLEVNVPGCIWKWWLPDLNTPVHSVICLILISFRTSDRNVSVESGGIWSGKIYVFSHWENICTFRIRVGIVTSPCLGWAHHPAWRHSLKEVAVAWGIWSALRAVLSEPLSPCIGLACWFAVVNWPLTPVSTPPLSPFSVLWWKEGRSSRGAWRPEFETALPLWFFWYWLNASASDM